MKLYNKGRKTIIGVQYEEGKFVAFEPGTTIEVQDSEAQRLLKIYPNFLVSIASTSTPKQVFVEPPKTQQDPVEPVQPDPNTDPNTGEGKSESKYSNLPHAELQKLAAEKSIKSVGVKRVDLIAALEAADAVGTDSSNTSPDSGKTA